MRTFFEDRRIDGSTFLVYGNTNDDFFCSDTTIRNLDQYLVSLLKSRGYEHIIFFGNDGTRGAYCLDAVSARYFFTANQGLPEAGSVPDQVQDTGTAGAAQGEAAGRSSGSSGSRLRDRRNKRRGYTPGSLSQSAQEPSREPEQDPGQDSGAQPPQPAQPAAMAPVKIQYALRHLELVNFYDQFRDRLLDPDSHMAMILYNALVESGEGNFISNFIPKMKTDILSNLPQTGDKNLLLFVAPETMGNSYDLQELIRRNGLNGKFLKSCDQGGGAVFNSDCCFRVGYPSQDEICNMLHRFVIMGTEYGDRIRLDYGKLEELAQRILANASVYAQRREKPQYRKMRSIAYRLANRIREEASKGFGKRPEVTLELIDEIWEAHTDPQPTMEKLNRRGWEKAYSAVSRAVRASHKAVRNLEVSQAPQVHKADLGLERFSQEVRAQEKPRPPIPNFILLGNPGTGKTEIAKLIGNILYEEGILKIGHTRMVTKGEMTNPYVGGVLRETMARIDEAEEGVLFIDEAHHLAHKDGGMNNEGTGKEIASTLVGAMTDPSRHFCTIMAGYPDAMPAVFDLDDGLRRRFNVEIRLDDYAPELLYEILLGMIRDAQYEVAPALVREQETPEGQRYVPLKAMVDRIYAERDRKRFGNAGDMKTLVNEATAMAEDDILYQHCFYGGLNGKVTEEYFVPRDLGMTTDKVLADMERDFVGMANVKKLLGELALTLERAQADGKNVDDLALNSIVLVGNPGTGKTTVANALAKLYYCFGLVGTPDIIVRSGSDLASQYQNDSSAAVAAIREAQNRKGFLFIDEAHNLNATALKAFMAPLTDRSKPFMACFAVYPEELEKFLALDPGSASRLENQIHLEDYTGEELYEILMRAMERDRYSADEKTQNLLRQLMNREYETRTNKTGNARRALSVLKKMVNQLNQRCKRENIPFTSPESRTFIQTDIPEELRRGLTAGDNASRLEDLVVLQQEVESFRAGNAQLKEILKKLIHKKRFQLRFQDLSTGIVEPGHYFFKGNAGTGKTTSLDYMGQVLFRMGMIKNPTPLKLSASHLVGQYMGQTGVQTRELLEQNMGRLILIDEAYALSDPNERAGTYKRDAINELVAKLDDAVFRKTTCVVFSGYEGDMDQLYEVNQGLRSRVKEVAFPDFTFEECVTILSDMLSERKATVDSQVLDLCSQQLLLQRRSAHFANGRTLREYANILVERRNSRLLSMSEEELDAIDIRCILAQDVPEDGQMLQLLNL